MLCWHEVVSDLPKSNLPKGNLPFGKLAVDSPKYFTPTDADGVLVEISTKDKYRLYEYPELGANLQHAKGAEKLHQALKLVEQEFDYKRPCQDSINIK